MPKFNEWPRQITFANGETGAYLGRCAISGRHRVAQDRPNGIGGSNVWTLDDNGVCRVTGEPGSGFDRAA